jgi:hypothetical protein
MNARFKIDLKGKNSFGSLHFHPSCAYKFVGLAYFHCSESCTAACVSDGLQSYSSLPMTVRNILLCQFQIDVVEVFSAIP